MKGDSYRRLTAEEMDRFRQVCIAGVNPKRECPLCRGRRLTAEIQHRYCDEDLAWEAHSVGVDCHKCKVRYSVLMRDEDHERAKADA